MADQAALYGLAGAIAGAALGAGAAVFGPMLLHRQQAHERRLQEARLEQREQGQAQLELDREERRSREGLAQRLINLRATTRSYQELLLQTFLELKSGRAVDPGAFEGNLATAHSALNSAFDEALLDGIWFAHAASAHFLLARGSMLDALGRGTPVDDRVDVTDLGHTLSHAAFTVAECVKNGVPVTAERNAEAEQALGQVEAARAELAAYIKGRLDARSADLSAPREAHRE
ncbi:hypothetical protein ACFYWY_30840 [Streptomyces sp. NPDC002870]|uniref:hypothetical protein n=1 Tax=Streptomyces sp. NPDC002870 TaxID=3364666 RepID=UPI0036B2F098